MKTKYIIFDKDGTLMDFEKFWVKILEAATENILNYYGASHDLAEDIYLGLGVENGIANINGIFCHSAAERMGEVYYDIMTSSGFNVDKDELFDTVRTEFRDCYHVGEAVANCKDLKALLTKLNTMGIGCAVVTSDDQYSTNMTLERLGVADCFDGVFVSDGIHPNKPDPYYINTLCTDKGITPDEIIMVGDTLTDMQFAENAGVRAIGIAKSDTNRDILSPYTVAVIDNLDKIMAYVD